MSKGGIFSAWQPAYAAHGIPTFPVTAEKKPATRGYLRTGLRGSAELARKFPDADAFGFPCGPRSKVTLLDIDSADERTLADALSMFGNTPLISQTASGGHHLWFRYSGETRRIRPVPDKPFDILGGGFALAPPSVIAKGAYSFVQGKLDDLDQLPTMVATYGRPLPITGSFPALAASFQQGPTGRVSSGRRNAALLRHCQEQAAYCDDVETLIDVAKTFCLLRCELEPGMTDAEIRGTALSAWTMQIEGRNWIQQRGQRVVFHHDDIDGLMRTDPDAFLLEAMLRRHHWNRDFVIANAMAESMPGGGWNRKRLAEARRVLLRRGRIIMIRRPGFGRRGKPVPGLYRWPDPTGGQK
jgi:Bifunctional DNA primase/polymerase, N-terminal